MSQLSGGAAQQQPPPEGERRCLNSELWHACAGPLVSLPAVGSRVVYFPQGHSEQVAASTNKEIDSHIPNYPSLPPQLICQLHDVTMHADLETDEVYAQMTLQPLSPQEQKDSYLPAELGTPSKQPTNYFCKTLTASDTSTHGGFSVPRRAAEKVFPPLDFTQQPPAQELIARDLHDNEWKFRHIFRGQPKRHLLTTGWSVFVSAKRLVAGDSVLFIWNDNNQLLLGIRHANRPPTAIPSSVLSSDSMHIGLLAAASHAAATNSRFTIFYNPRSCPSEFVIPLVKYVKAVYHTHVSVGMRFRMLFETEESSVRRYMGTITGVCDLDPARWPNSHWRSVKVGWDESTAGERQPRVSLWEVEPLTTFPMYPSPFPLRLKRPWPPGLPSLYGGRDNDMGLNNPLMWLGNGNPGIQSLNFQGIGANPWLHQRLDNSMLGLQPDMYESMAAAALQEFRTVDSSTLLQFQQPQNITSRATPLLPSQLVQVPPPLQQTFAQTNQDNNARNQTQSSLFQKQLQHCQSFSAQPQMQQQNQQIHQQQQHQQVPHLLQQQQQAQQKHISDPQEIPVVTAISQPTSASQFHPPVSQAASSFPQQQNFQDSNSTAESRTGNSPLHRILGPFSPEDSSHLLSGSRTNSSITSGPRVKRIAIESMAPSEAECVKPQIEQFCSGQPNAPQHSDLLAPFPGNESSLNQEDCIDTQNHLLFGINIEPQSLLVQNDMHLGSEAASTAMPYSEANFLSSQGMDFPLNQVVKSSSCLGKTGFLQSPENTGQGNQQSVTFVKVYKSGSFGRSLDITRFNSYLELRREIEMLFGLEGQLEDPLRSGWQLVFVDRENDVLLLGDDPWQEFVNSVWCIQILSPQEVQHMGKKGVNLPSSVSNNRLSNSSCDDYVTRQDSRTGIVSVGSLDY